MLSIAFSPDGKLLASASDDGSIKLWRLTKDGAVVYETLWAHKEAVLSVTFSPDGTTLASGGRDNSIKLWRLIVGGATEYATLVEHDDSVLTLAFSPDGKTLASGSNDATIKLWRMTAAGAYRIATLIGHMGFVRSIAFSPDQKTLASGSNDSTVKLWRLTSDGASEYATLTGCKDSVLSVAFSPDGKTLAGGGRDGTIRLWRLTARGGTESATLIGHKGAVWSVVFSPVGNAFVSGGNDNSIRLWQLTDDGAFNNATLTGQKTSVLSVAFSPDGKALASGSNDASVKLWHLSRDGASEYASLSEHKDAVTSVAYSADGGMLATGSNDRSIILWRRTAEGARRLETLTGHTGQILSVAFSSDGKFLASGSRDNSIKLWRLTPEGAREFATLTGHSYAVTSVAFSPDGKSLASASQDSSIKLWRWTAEGGYKFVTLKGHAFTVTSVAFSPDGEILASGSGDGSIKLWRLTQNGAKEFAKLTGHMDAVTTVAFSPSGNVVASGSKDNSTKLWQLGSSGANAQTSRMGLSPVRAVAFSPDGEQLVVVSDSAQVLTATGVNPLRLLAEIRWFDGSQWLSTRPDSIQVAGSSQGHDNLRSRFPQDLSSDIYEARCYLGAIGLVRADDQRMPTTSALEPRSECRSIKLPSLFSRIAVWSPAFVGASMALASVYFLRRRRRELRKRLFSELGLRSEKLLEEHAGLYRGRSEGGNDPRYLVMNVFPSVEDGQRLTQVAGILNTCYVVSDEPFDLDDLPPLRAVFGSIPVVVLSTAQIGDVLSAEHPKARFAELTDRYAVAGDPYDVSNAIDDPAWFFGREHELEDAQTAISRGEHLLVLGLRKSGKSSVAKQLRARFANSPVAWFDCQQLGGNADTQRTAIEGAVLHQLDRGIRLLGAKKSPSYHDSFASGLESRIQKWRKRNPHEPVVLFFDEIDKLAPAENEAGDLTDDERRAILRVYVDIFRAIRGVAQQNGQALSVVCISYRPTVARVNILYEGAFENPMFQSFKEVYVGPLSTESAVDMIEKLGRQKGITWDRAASERVVSLAGGFPLVCRRIASEVTDGAARKDITLARVDEVAKTIQRRWGASVIADYFDQSIWQILTVPEREVLRQVAAGDPSCSAEVVPKTLEKALVGLERFGLVTITGDQITVTGELLRSWVREKGV